jgi:putative glutamine amidotransferase
MRRAPLILIGAGTEGRGAEFGDVSSSLSHQYAKAVVAAGGLPWVLPCVGDRGAVGEAVRRCDGVLLTGGEDVQPGLYGDGLASRLLKTVKVVDPLRDYHELLLIGEVFRRGKPLLAVCRGMQLLNVALGGTLWVDIATQVPGSIGHRRMDRKDRVVHKVALTPDSLLSKITARQALGVNSTHHQAVDRLADLLCATAIAPDGVVEGLELAPTAKGVLPFLLAVQFHPERLYERHAEFLAVFRCFTRACETRQRMPV